MSEEIPRGLGFTGTIDLRSYNSAPGVTELTDKVHLLPCCIKQDGPCPISQYFKPKETGIEVDGLKVKEAFFRGRRLQGATLKIPDGYSGFVLGKEDSQDKCAAEGDSKSNCWSSKAEFRNITYWNHDDVPSQDDPTLRCFHWFTIADALHKPVTADDMASALSDMDTRL